MQILLGDLFRTLGTAVCYAVFNQQFFCCTAVILEQKPPRRLHLVWTFVLNYLIFVACSLLSLHLIVNWTVFLVLLFGEALLLFGHRVKGSFLAALMGVQLGLAVNILLRSLVALLLDVPLVAFDNNTLMTGNMKVYPVLLGFLLAGALLWLARRFGWLKNLPLVLRSNMTLTFLLGLLLAMQLYLCLNLLVYSIPQNTPVLKLWSMKSSIFVLMGEAISGVFAVRMGRLAAYRAENQRARQILAEEQLRQREFETIAQTDTLTGCENRAATEKYLVDAQAADRPFCLCFADLNGLKAVNDTFGHKMGDEYLLTVVHALKQICGPGDKLFRYGGDEFVLVSRGVTARQADQRLQQAQRELRQAKARRGLPFSMSISYGIVESAAAASPAELLQRADGLMYQMKTARITGAEE